MMQSSNAAASGDIRADGAAYALAYKELKRCAPRQRSVTPGSSLTPTALVNEIYLKLRGARMQRVQDRRHFFGIAARAMRYRITVWDFMPPHAA